MEEIKWMWKGYLADGKITMFNGEPGSNKSSVALDIAARLSTQKEWPDGTPNDVPASSTLVITSEDDPSDTIIPRFLAAGGARSKLHFLNEGGTDPFYVEKNIAALKGLIKGVPDLRLVILDPAI
jgi:putative DNA primase/helicase